MNKKVKIITVLALLVLIVSTLTIIDYAKRNEKEKCYSDYLALYEVQAEAYINVHSDVDFKNTATDEQYMLVPEKYYTNRESAMGDGPLRVYITKDGTIIACFGDLEHVQAYYDRGFLGPTG